MRSTSYFELNFKLLQRSPGEPLDTSNQSLKSNGQNNKEEDKENESVDEQHLATLQPSQTMANAIVPLINQSENGKKCVLFYLFSPCKSPRLNCFEVFVKLFYIFN